MRVYMPRGIDPDSWLNEQRCAEFRIRYGFAGSQTRAIPALSMLDAEDVYWLWHILTCPGADARVAMSSAQESSGATEKLAPR